MLYQGKCGSFDCCVACFSKFDACEHKPVTLECTHSICRKCFDKHNNCPLDGKDCIKEITHNLPPNIPLLYSLGFGEQLTTEDLDKYNQVSEQVFTGVAAKHQIDKYKCLHDCLISFACLLKAPLPSSCEDPHDFSPQMERKLRSLIHTQPLTPKGRKETSRCLVSIYERLITQLVHLQYSKSTQEKKFRNFLSKPKGCSIPHPKVQEEILKQLWLVMSQESGGRRIAYERNTINRHVELKLSGLPFIRFPDIKTTVRKMFQLLYNLDCFDRTQTSPTEICLFRLRNDIRSLEEFRHHYNLNVIKLATDHKNVSSHSPDPIRMTPEHWSLILYGDTHRRSEMQSILDKIQIKPSLKELQQILRRNKDPFNLVPILPRLEELRVLTDTASEDSSIELTCDIANRLLELKPYLILKRHS